MESPVEDFSRQSTLHFRVSQYVHELNCFVLLTSEEEKEILLRERLQLQQHT